MDIATLYNSLFLFYSENSESITYHKKYVKFGSIFDG